MLLVVVSFKFECIVESLAKPDFGVWKVKRVDVFCETVWYSRKIYQMLL